MRFSFLESASLVLLALTTVDAAYPAATKTTTKKTSSIKTKTSTIKTSTIKTSTIKTSTVKTTTVKPTSTVKSTASATPTAATGTKYVFNFGDSYSQTGFDLTGTKPASGNIFGNPPFPGWTTANGNRQNWLGTLVTKYNSSEVLTYNLASGGATTDADLVQPYAPYPTVLSLINQVSEFTTTLSPAPSYAPWTASDSLFSVWIGVNDVGNGWYQSNWATLYPQILAQYFAQLQLLYNAGARRFLLLSVPPIYLTPNVVAQGKDVQDLEKAAIAQYNDLLKSKATAFQGANAGSKVTVFDTTDAFARPLADPTAYGATDATCFQESGTSCLWFNDYHPGQTIHDEVAKGAAAALGTW